MWSENLLAENFKNICIYSYLISKNLFYIQKMAYRHLKTYFIISGLTILQATALTPQPSHAHGGSKDWCEDGRCNHKNC